MDVTISLGSNEEIRSAVSEGTAKYGLEGKRWILLYLGSVRISLEDFNEKCARQARDIARELLRAAEEIDPTARYEPETPRMELVGAPVPVSEITVTTDELRIAGAPEAETLPGNTENRPPRIGDVASSPLAPESDTPDTDDRF